VTGDLGVLRQGQIIRSENLSRLTAEDFRFSETRRNRREDGHRSAHQQGACKRAYRLAG
jgi:hypothetical protein